MSQSRRPESLSHSLAKLSSSEMSVQNNSTIPSVENLNNNTEPRPKFNKQESIKKITTYLDSLDKNKEKNAYSKRQTQMGIILKGTVLLKK